MTITTERPAVTAAGLPETVSGRQATAPLVSLLTSAAVVETTDPHLASGVTFEPEACGTVAAVAGVCTAPGAALPDPPANTGAVTVRPVQLVAADRCSTFASAERQGGERARRLLLATQHRGVEHEPGRARSPAPSRATRGRTRARSCATRRPSRT